MNKLQSDVHELLSMEKEAAIGVQRDAVADHQRTAEGYPKTRSAGSLGEKAEYDGRMRPSGSSAKPCLRRGLRNSWKFECGAAWVYAFIPPVAEEADQPRHDRQRLNSPARSYW